MSNTEVVLATLKRSNNITVNYFHDGSGPTIDGHPRSMDLFEHDIVEGERTLFSGIVDLRQNIADAVDATIWQLHPAASTVPVQLRTNHSAGYLQLKLDSAVEKNFPLSGLKKAVQITISTLHHRTAGDIVITVGDITHRVSGVSTMDDETGEWMHVGCLTGSDDTDHPGTTIPWTGARMYVLS